MNSSANAQTEARVCFLTGASKRLGASTARKFHAEGFNVIIHFNNSRQEAESLVAQLNSLREGSAKSLQADLTDREQLKLLANQVLGCYQRLDVLVNNAGVVPETLRRTAEGNEVSMATAMGGSFLLTSLLLPTLKKNRPSRVVNMSSGGMYTCKLDPSNLNCEKDGPENYDGVFAYAHAKRAQVILTEMWQEKLRGSGVTFHSTHPGWCDTPGVQGKSMDWFNSRMEGRLRTPAQGIDTAAWLAGAADPRLDDSAAGGGDFWFDRVPVRKHMPLAWTRESPADRLSLWKRLCEMWSHEPEV